MKTFTQCLGEAFIISVISAAVLTGAFYIFSPSNTDPAITALKEAKYSNIHFIGDRKGTCETDKEVIEALLSLNAIPKIEIKESYSCFFGARWIAKDVNGSLEMGNIYCGPTVKARPPFKYCDIYDDASSEPIESLTGPDHD